MLSNGCGSQNTIKGTVFFDQNANGEFETGETGKAGVTVYLYADKDDDGVLDANEATPIDSLETDANGEYKFIRDYSCELKYIKSIKHSYGISDASNALGAPNASFATYDMDVDELIVKLDGTIKNGDSYSIYLGAIEANPYAIISESTNGVDFYYNSSIAIGGATSSAYEITAGRAVNYIKFDKHSIAQISGYNSYGSVTTNVSDYKVFGVAFCGDTVDSYIINIDANDLPNSTNLTTDNIEVASFTSGGNVDPNNDFGYIGPENLITGTVFLDTDRNATLDSGEPGESGVTVYLYADANDNGIIEAGESTPVDSVVTDENGFYIFTRSYSCGIKYIKSIKHSADIADASNAVGAPNSSFATYDGNLDELIVELDGTIKNGDSYSIYLGAIEANPYAIISESTNGIDFYYNSSIAISSASSQAYSITAKRDVKYIKFDKNYIIQISGYNSYGSVTTNVSDYKLYGIEFCGDTIDSYVIKIDSTDLPSGTFLTTDNKEVASFTSGGNLDPNNNFGFIYNGTISGVVGVDNDNDGTTAEEFLDGIVIILITDLNSNGNADVGEPTQNTTTNASGEYLFENLNPGEYLVVETQPEDYASVRDGDVSDDGDANDATFDQNDIILVTLTNGEDDEDNNFLEAKKFGNISGSVFADNNGGTPSKDAPLSGVKVRLYRDVNNDGIAQKSELLSTTTTAANGSYSFTNLPVGNYLVTEIQPWGYVDVRDGDESKDGDLTDSTFNKDNKISVVIDPNETDSDNNLCLLRIIPLWSSNCYN